MLIIRELEAKLNDYHIGSQDGLGRLLKTKSRRMAIGCYSAICIFLNE